MRPQRRDLEDYLVRHKEDLFCLFATLGTEAGLLQFAQGSSTPISRAYAQELLPKIDDHVSELLGTRRPLPECVVESPAYWWMQGVKAAMLPLGAAMLSNLGYYAFMGRQSSILLPLVIGLGTGVMVGGTAGILKAKDAHEAFKQRRSPYYMDGKIFPMPSTIDDAVGVLAHELTHHYQEGTLLENSLLSEGHARGVQLSVVRAWNPAHGPLLTQTMNLAAGELKRACEYLRDNLDQDFHGFDFDLYQIPVTNTPQYFLGTAAMLVAEKFHGAGIYAATLRGDLSFLD
jgi:hypothetical protein